MVGWGASREKSRTHLHLRSMFALAMSSGSLATARRTGLRRRPYHGGPSSARADGYRLELAQVDPNVRGGPAPEPPMSSGFFASSSFRLKPAPGL